MAPLEFKLLGGHLRMFYISPQASIFFVSTSNIFDSGPTQNGWGNGPAYARPQANAGWDMPPPQPQQRSFNANAYGPPREFRGGDARGHGEGRWVDGKHVPGNPNPRLERELFGSNDPNARTTQTTGINFDKYDDIPVEASGHDVPEAVTEFTSPPLDDHLLSNISLAGYKNPTPVQKYSIPIVMGGRDLMACAQTGLSSLCCEIPCS